jgi:glycosyltransferase involved in cell wall biosynthesis
MTHDSLAASRIDLSRQKVLFVFLGSELGGAERQGLLLARSLERTYGADVEVLGLGASGPGRVAELCAESGIRWRALPFAWSGKSSERFRALRRLAWQLRKARPDAILGYTWLPNVVCGLIWRFTSASMFVWNQRDDGLDLDRSSLHRWAVRLTTCFIANAANGQEFLVQTYGVDPDRCSIVRNGVVPPLHDLNRGVCRERFGIPADTFVACMVGNLHRNKDHATLLRAWRIVLTRASATTPPLRLLLAGRFDDLAGSLQDLAVALELGGSVHFCGEIRNVPELLCAADLYVHSSPREGSPNGVLEAMAAGLPVVGTAIPGIREALGEEMDDCLAPTGDAAALAGKIIEMIDDAPRRSACGAANARRIAEVFDVENMAAGYATILHEHLTPRVR